MRLDRHLIDTIKTHFVRKSAAQLREIAQSHDHEHWSAEAVVAAGEVLDARMAGLAQEPLVADDEPPPQNPGNVVSSLAFWAGLNLITLPLGILVLPRIRAGVRDTVAGDRPVPFGAEIAWMALRTTDSEGVASALDLLRTRETAWEDGIAAAYQTSVFVTPPVGEWTLVVGATLFPPDQVGAFVKPVLELLSRRFGEAQYFCTHRDAGLYVWAKAQKGKLIRGYGRLGSQDRILWEEGAPTKQEHYVGLRFVDGISPTIKVSEDDEPIVPDENCVMQLACLWSVDPTTLDEEFKEPVLGLLGQLTWGVSGTVR